MDRMKPYQYLYFVVMHKLKKLIAKDQGKVYHFDMTMVPDELGLEKTMYYLQEMNIDFYNPLKNMDVAGAFQRGKVTNSTDMSNMQYIIQYINVLNFFSLCAFLGIIKFSSTTSTCSSLNSFIVDKKPILR